MEVALLVLGAAGLGTIVSLAAYHGTILVIELMTQ